MILVYAYSDGITHSVKLTTQIINLKMADFESIYHDEGFADWDDYESYSEHGRTGRDSLPASVYRVRHNMEGLDPCKDREEYRQWQDNRDNSFRKKSKLQKSERFKKFSNERKPGLAPRCPRCGKTMVMRLAMRGFNAGNHFWGCSFFPKCRGSRSLKKK